MSEGFLPLCTLQILAVLGTAEENVHTSFRELQQHLVDFREHLAGFCKEPQFSVLLQGPTKLFEIPPYERLHLEGEGGARGWYSSVLS